MKSTHDVDALPRLSLHGLGATTWVDDHRTLAVTVLPNALNQQRAANRQSVRTALGRSRPGLAIQIVTGLCARLSPARFTGSLVRQQPRRAHRSARARLAKRCDVR